MSNGFNCSKVLLEDPNVLIEVPKQQIPIIDLIIQKINNGNKKYLEILEILLKKKKIDKNDMAVLRTAVYYNDIEIVKVFLNTNPQCLNKSSDDKDGNTIVHMALQENLTDMIKLFFTFKQLDFKKANKDDTNYLEYLCGFKMFDLLDLFCKNYPKAIGITNSNSNSVTEVIINSFNFNTMSSKEFEDIKKVIKILVANGADINYRNKMGYTLIFPSIQYSNEKFVKFMIEMGANINEPLIRNTEFPPVSNNDPIGFAVQLGKLSMLKLLVESKGSLHQIVTNGINIYTSVLMAIRYGRDDHMDYLVTIPEISNWLTSSVLVSNYLFDYAVKNICMNKDVLKYFATESKINSLCLNDPKYSINWNEKKISINIDEYKDMDINNKKFVLEGLLESIRILIKLSSINYKQYYIVYENFENLYENVSSGIKNYEEIKKINSDYESWIEEFSNIICDRIDFHCLLTIKKIFECVFNLYWEIPDEDQYDLDSETDILNAVFVPKHYVKKLNSMYKQIKEKKSLFEDYEKELVLIIDKYENDVNKNLVVYKDKHLIEQDVIIKKLFKLYFPIKQPHYEYVYHNIIHNTDKIISSPNSNIKSNWSNNRINKTDKNIIVESENKIKSTIFYCSDNKVPSKWIKTYAPNIGKEEKTDQNHMFPFSLDMLLETFPTVEIETIDSVHGWTNHMYYFSGIMEYDGDMETGCYEYFINSNGTLFHRMFRPWTNLPENIKKMIKH
jgi:ankyrin repeat protein